MVPEARIEPARFFVQGNLSLWCLPFHYPGRYGENFPPGGVCSTFIFRMHDVAKTVMVSDDRYLSAMSNLGQSVRGRL